MRYVHAFAFVAVIGLALPPSAPAQPDAAADAQANALFDAYWEWVPRAYPDFGTLYFADHRYGDRLRDESAAAVAARRAAVKGFQEGASKIDAAKLSAPNRVSLRVLRSRLDTQARLDALYGALPFATRDPWAPVTQLDGLHLLLPELARAAPFRNVADYEAWLKRLDAVPQAVEQLIERMQMAQRAGWMPPKAAIERVPQQIEARVVDDPRTSAEFAPFKAFPETIGADERRLLADAGARAIRERVVPAFRTLKSYYESRYLPAASERLGVSNLPAGPAYYQAHLEFNTNTRMTPREIHDLGLAEVKRIGGLMDALVAKTGFNGTRAQFQEFIKTDPRFFYTQPEDMLAGYRDIAKRADAQMPRLFAELPRMQYGIRAQPPEAGAGPERYTPGAADGSRPGWFEANVHDLRTKPKWLMESLTLHEAVPGHHMQSARAREARSLPTFRRFLWFVAYGEGWALYAESLGDEIGFYADPYQKFGNLSYEMHRACRLVVDTGLHAFGWTREQAIDYIVEHTGKTRGEALAEVDRYLVWPGQATAYKIGELRIKALRAKASAALGERFDLRRFHNVLIDNGAMPLDVLEELVDQWITGERAKPAP